MDYQSYLSFSLAASSTSVLPNPGIRDPTASFSNPYRTSHSPSNQIVKHEKKNRTKHDAIAHIKRVARGTNKGYLC